MVARKIVTRQKTKVHAQQHHGDSGRRCHRVNFRRIGLMAANVLFFCGVFLAGMYGFSPSLNAWADTDLPTGLATGSALFETNCAGCHPKGGNIIKRGKTLKLKPLTRRHLDSVDAIATFVTNGKGLMSAYGDILTTDEIDVVSAYVWDQAQGNWKP